MGDQYKSYMPAKNDLSMFVTPVSEPEMKKLIMQLNDSIVQLTDTALS